MGRVLRLTVLLLGWSYHSARGEGVSLPPFLSDIVTDMISQEHITPQDVATLRDKYLEAILTATSPAIGTKMEYPYFAFVPNHVASLPMDGKEVSWTGHCFRSIKGHILHQDASSITVQLTAQRPKSLLCTELQFLATTSAFHFENTITRGQYNIKFDIPSNITDGDKWDMETQGLRVFSFTTTLEETFESIIETARLFRPLLTQGVSKEDAQRNADFMKAYAGFDIKARDPSLNYDISEADVQSGDMFLVLRLDGLDPMLAWGMGSTNGHVTMALWMDGELFVIESQVKSSYWPTDNVQRTPFATWVKQAKAAGYNTVHVPLKASARAAFDEARAREWFEGVQGLAYGYHSLLWGWVDTPSDNYPCIPSDYKRCLEWKLLEVAFALLDRHIPALADLLWVQAFNFRLGTQGLRTADLYYQASLQGLNDSAKLPALVEKDSFMYETTRYNKTNVVKGRSMVCCVFVCSVWKAAGVFDEIDADFECEEQTNFDIYSLALFESNYTQITGDHTLYLQDFNTRTPYKHMSDSCPGLPPKYERPGDC